MIELNTDLSVVITGANGFIGKNLAFRLRELNFQKVALLTRETTRADWQNTIAEADVIFHLAGTNRPKDETDFETVNIGVAEQLSETVRRGGRNPYIINAGSTKADDNTAYGISKAVAENRLSSLMEEGVARVANWRLPNVFGKWSKPNYNSAIATFCHNIARGLPITVHDANARLNLLYIDDLLDQWVQSLLKVPYDTGLLSPSRVYETTIGEVARSIQAIQDDRPSLFVGSVGHGLTRALYATYMSSLPPDRFSYAIPAYSDARGSFSEFLKTPCHGQCSYFTARPGVTRGGHYHHSKTEKFLIVQGNARFRFRHMVTGEHYDIYTDGTKPVIVETIPGWTHDVTNVGSDMLIALLWANEIFDRVKPDTISQPLDTQ